MNDNVINLPCGISLEQINDNVYLVRGHDDGGKYGDSWRWVTVAVVAGKSVEIKGLCVAEGGNFTIHDHINLAKYFRSIGVVEGWYERVKNDKIYRYKLK